MSNICWVCHLQSLSFIACFILENIFGIFTQKWIMKYFDQSFHFWENFCVQSRRSSQSAFSLGNHTKSIQTRFLSICFCVGGLSAGFLSSFALVPVVRQHMIASSAWLNHSPCGQVEKERDKRQKSQSHGSTDHRLRRPLTRPSLAKFLLFSISLGCKQSIKIWATRGHCWYTKWHLLTWATFYLK